MADDRLISLNAALDAFKKELTVEESKGNYVTICSAVSYVGAKQILEGLPSAQQWIPCSERLPEPGEYYLVTRQYFGWNCTEYREIDIAKYDFDGWPKAYTVLAWCELPEPYKEDEDDE